jgi:hypothetical protein
VCNAHPQGHFKKGNFIMKFVRILSAAAVAASLSTTAFAGGFADSKAGAIGFGFAQGKINATGSQQNTGTISGTGKHSFGGAVASNTSFAVSSGKDSVAVSGGAAFASSKAAKH